MTYCVKQLFTVIHILLLSASLALGASVSVKPSGDGIFIIHGNNMDGVVGIELLVDYDSPSLASPKVEQGSLVSGAMFAANPNFKASTVKIGIISTTPFSGSGQIAVITFASHTGTGSITVSTNMINSRGASLSTGERFTATDLQTTATGSTGFTTSPGVPFSQPPPVTAPTVTPTIQTYLGTVNTPADIPAKSDAKPAETTGEPVQFTEPAVAKPAELPEKKQVSETKQPEKVKMTSYKGTLEYFRTYKGKKSPADLIVLFNTSIAPTIRQEPAVALSDGKTPVKIVVKLEDAGDKLPNFALDGAKLVSLTKDDAAFTWIVEALPQASSVQASLTILHMREIIVYPLTLAPPIKGISLAEADFVDFLQDSGASTPKRDLNGDGKHDYLDDFIYTANYLSRKNAAGKAEK
jgi:hypothetical protein